MGRGYVVEHCISTFHKNQKEMMYRIYVTDALKDLIEVQVTRGGGDIKYRRFYDFIKEKPEKEQTEEHPEETAEDIIARIKNNMFNMGK